MGTRSGCRQNFMSAARRGRTISKEPVRIQRIPCALDARTSPAPMATVSTITIKLKSIQPR